MRGGGRAGAREWARGNEGSEGIGVEAKPDEGVAAIGLGLLANFEFTGKEQGAGGERDGSAGGERNEYTHDVGWEIVAGAVFYLVHEDGLGREEEDAGGGQGLAHHEADEANFLTVEGTEFVSKLQATITDDGIEKIGEL